MEWLDLLILGLPLIIMLGVIFESDALFKAAIVTAVVLVFLGILLYHLQSHPIIVKSLAG